MGDLAHCWRHLTPDGWASIITLDVIHEMR